MNEGYLDYIPIVIKGWGGPRPYIPVGIEGTGTVIGGTGPHWGIKGS